jgi:hypothetical protein
MNRIEIVPLSTFMLDLKNSIHAKKRITLEV